ncbi:UNKNOWN [Stylonychia lemnae]|uniref:Uncharacterized protein n=1 Tax=Stylonychia lemnae TaxID=5949 RepID=A0A077ZY86_STYLE|nr:UNKNOWN [Stylonychia lemnae]|eukprot:CDW74851.1 UNKNOWN [Stylonychia lemnae]
MNGYVDEQTNQCVSNCGPGRYGNITLDNQGMIELTQCLDCHPSCFECSSEQECKSCNKGYYLEIQQGKTSGVCKRKQGQFEGQFYVQSKVLNIEARQDGTIDYPFNSIMAALKNAYQTGISYQEATIELLLFSNQTHSIIKNDEILYTLQKIDNSQSVKIIIDTVDSIPTKVYYKLRNKFKFKVSAGLIIRNIEFDATDSIFDPKESNIYFAQQDIKIMNACNLQQIHAVNHQKQFL